MLSNVVFNVAAGNVVAASLSNTSILVHFKPTVLVSVFFVFRAQCKTSSLMHLLWQNNAIDFSLIATGKL